MNIKDRIVSGWNAFLGRDPTPKSTFPTYISSLSSGRPDQIHLTRGNERTIINSILNRIAVDAAALHVEHVDLDESRRYRATRESKLNECLTVSTNLDQDARSFMQDAVMSLLDEGVIAIVPTRATDSPILTSSYDIGAMRIGKVVRWMPHHVVVNLYNEDTGDREDRTFPKHMVALPENPFYAIMNEPNSIYRRLMVKLRQLDTIDSESASGKMNLILQLPYSTKSTFRQEQAKQRQDEVEHQLSSSKYGIAYIDANERVIQLNRAVENNLFTQVEYYTNLLFSLLGMTVGVLDGSADEKTMLNYENRIVEPIISAVVNSMRWKFLSPTARTQGQTIMVFKDMFKFTTATDMANNADKLIRNEVLTKNEFRQIIGFKPSDDPTADTLSNPNMPVKDQVGASGAEVEEDVPQEEMY